MISAEKVKKIQELLKRDYPEVKTPLLHTSLFQLLCATMLSAQTLDATVNTITPTLFEKYPTAKEMSKANSSDIDKIISKVNYHHTKAENLIAMSKKLLSDFGGVVPYTIENLTELPGVGRKTANVVISEWFAQKLKNRGNPWPGGPKTKIYMNGDERITQAEGFVVDTHVIRVSNRLGLTTSKDPKKIEQDLMKIFPQSEWAETSLRIIFHGRYMCKARQNLCCNDPEWKKLCNEC